MQWREIVQAELHAVAGVGRGSAATTAWNEHDEALLQQHLGRDGYLELMTATEEALLRELQSDLAFLSGGDASEYGAAREYEAFLAQEDALVAASADELDALPGEDAVLCPLCMRGTTVRKENSWSRRGPEVGPKAGARSLQMKQGRALRGSWGQSE